MRNKKETVRCGRWNGDPPSSQTNGTMARQDAEGRKAEGGNEQADLRGGVKFSFSDFAYYQDQPHKKAFKAIRIGTKARWLFVSAEFCR